LFRELVRLANKIIEVDSWHRLPLWFCRWSTVRRRLWIGTPPRLEDVDSLDLPAEDADRRLNGRMLANFALHGALPWRALGFLVLHQAGGGDRSAILGVIENDPCGRSQELRDFSLEGRLPSARDRGAVKRRAAGEGKHNFAGSKRDQSAVRERGPQARRALADRLRGAMPPLRGGESRLFVVGFARRRLVVAGRGGGNGGRGGQRSRLRHESSRVRSDLLALRGCGPSRWAMSRAAPLWRSALGSKLPAQAAPP